MRDNSVLLTPQVPKLNRRRLATNISLVAIDLPAKLPLHQVHKQQEMPTRYRRKISKITLELLPIMKQTGERHPDPRRGESDAASREVLVRIAPDDAS